jgi:hypothetical protein
MRLEKIAQLANIIAIIPGAYSAYAAYALLHPQQQTQQLTQDHAGISTMATGLLVSFVAFCACIAAGGVLNSIVLFRKPDVPLPPSAAQNQPPPLSPPPPLPPMESAKKAEERIFVDVTPEYLAGFFKDHTNIQGQRLFSPYKGKWMERSGHLGEVSHVHLTELLQVSFEELVGGVTMSMFFSTRWTDHFSVMKRGDPLTVRGRIDNAGPNIVSLQDCELVFYGSHSSPIVQT